LGRLRDGLDPREGLVIRVANPDTRPKIVYQKPNLAEQNLFQRKLETMPKQSSEPKRLEGEP